VGLIEDFLVNYFRQSGFARWRRVEEFSVFDDASGLRVGEYLISLNMIATK
jgi:hypothetical protein